MKHLILFALAFISFKSYAQNADAIIGRWINIPKENTIIEVFKEKGEYKGHITWTKESNPKKPVGFLILDGLQYNRNSGKWENGEIHEPASGGTYSATAKILKDGTLEVHGYMGIQLLGSTKKFKRVK